MEAGGIRNDGNQPALVNIDMSGEDDGEWPKPVSPAPHRAQMFPGIAQNTQPSTSAMMPPVESVMRQRSAVHNVYTNNSMHGTIPARPSSPLRTHSYEAKPVGRWKSFKTYLSNLVVPRQTDYAKKFDDGGGPMGWKKPPPPKTPCQRAMQILCAAILIFVISMAAVIAADWASSSYDVNEMQTASLLSMFDGVKDGGREGKLQKIVYLNSSEGGEGVQVVYNVLEPTHAVETPEDVHSLFRKLTALNLKAKSLTPLQLRQGFITYKHSRVGDADADMVQVNATLDGIESLIVRERRPQASCESYMQYGLEYNAIVLFTGDFDSSDKYTVLYNAKIDEYDDTAEKKDEGTQFVNSRIHEAGEADNSTMIVNNVPMLLTVEYNTRRALRKRLKISNDAKKAACVIHSLRMAGHIQWGD